MSPQIIGKTLLCKTLDIAETMSQMHKLTGITLDGQKAKPKGEYEGGYHDASRSIFQLQADHQKCVTTLARLQDKEAKAKQVRLVVEVVAVVESCSPFSVFVPLSEHQCWRWNWRFIGRYLHVLAR